MPSILFIGQHFPPGMLQTLNRDTRGRAGYSNHNFETALLHGLAQVPGVSVRALTVPLQYSWPHSSTRPWIRAERHSDGDVPVRSIGYPNLPGASLVTPVMPLAGAILHELSRMPDEEVTVVVNTPALPISLALEAVRRLTRRRLTTALVVPDIPSQVTEMAGMAGAKAKIFGALNSWSMRLARRYDRVVMLTEAMNDFFALPPEQRLVMEGLVDERRLRALPVPRPLPEGVREVILYTGSLFRVFGVMTLVEAFRLGDFPHAELWICGSGETAEELERISREDPRIRFFGLVDAAKALELQSQATILANPRPSTGEYTQYSFPSKTLEYLIAGKTVIMNRLPGVPEEYDRYVHYAQDETPQGWARTLDDIMHSDGARRAARDAGGRRFVLDSKTATAQALRLARWLGLAPDGHTPSHPAEARLTNPDKTHKR